MYRKRAIITCVLYIHYPIFIVHFFVFKEVFFSIRERFVIKSGL